MMKDITTIKVDGKTLDMLRRIQGWRKYITGTSITYNDIIFEFCEKELKRIGEEGG